MDIEELNNWFLHFERIIFDAKISIDNIRRLENTKNKFEKDALKYGFFHHTYLQNRFTIIVQLAKLLSEKKSQKKSFIKFFNKLTCSKFDNEIAQHLENNKPRKDLIKTSKELLTEVDLQRKKINDHLDLVSKLVDLRDKIYAHSDPDPVNQNITTNELEVLINLCVDIYNSFRGKMFDKHFMFEVNNDWTVDYCLETIAKRYEENEIKRQEVLENLRKNKEQLKD